MKHTDLHISRKDQKRLAWHKWTGDISGSVKGDHWCRVYALTENQLNERLSFMVKACNSHEELVDALDAMCTAFEQVGNRDYKELKKAQELLTKIKNQ